MSVNALFLYIESVYQIAFVAHWVYFTGSNPKHVLRVKMLLFRDMIHWISGEASLKMAEEDDVALLPMHFSYWKRWSVSNEKLEYEYGDEVLITSLLHPIEEQQI